MSPTPIGWLFFHSCNIISMIDQKSVHQEYQMNRCVRLKVAKFWMSFYFWLARLTAAIMQEHLDNNSILDNLDRSTKDPPHNRSHTAVSGPQTQAASAARPP